jgi:hypothetical protein
MADFNGFRNTTLIGKNDLPAGASVVKIPQDNLTVHEYVVEPKPPSTTRLDSGVMNNIQTIIGNVKYENYLQTSSKSAISSKTESILVAEAP